jgi:hypothetical protein
MSLDISNSFRKDKGITLYQNICSLVKRILMWFYLVLVDSRCTPPDPLSNRFFLSMRFFICLRGGVILRGGVAPSLMYTPLQPAITAVSSVCQAGEGSGVR